MERVLWVFLGSSVSFGRRGNDRRKCLRLSPVSALADSVVLDSEAVLMRTEHHQFFEAALTFHTDRLTS